MNSRLAHLLLAATVIALAGTSASCTRHARVSRHLARAEQFLAAGQYDEAEIEYRNVMQYDPANATGIRRLGAIYQDEGRIGQAVPFLRRAEELQPDNLDVRYRLGLVYLATGHADEARAEARFILEHDAGNADAPLLLAESTVDQRESAAAEQQLKSLPAAVVNRAPVLVALGELQLRRGDLNAAEALFKRAVAADATSANAVAALGTVYRAKKDLPAADQSFKRAAELSPVRSPRRLQYAQYKFQTGDTASAKTLLDVINHEAPDYLPGWLWRGEVALAEGKPDEAATAAGNALSRDPMHADALLLSARVHVAQGQLDQAVADLERVVMLYPQSAVGHYQLAMVLQRRGEPAKAREHLVRSVTLAPTFAPPALALADLNIRFRNYGSAIAGLKQLIAHNDSAAAQLLLARAYQAQGNLDDAMAIYRAVERQFPENTQTPYYRGMILREQSRLPEARAAFERAARLNPDSSLWLEELVQLDIAEKKYAAARLRLAPIVAKNPHSAEPLLLLAKVFAAERNATETEATLHRAIAAQPENPAPYLLLAHLYIDSNRYEKAVENLQTLLTKTPRDVEALTLLAVLYHAHNQYAAARDAYEKLLAASPQSLIALNNLAYLYVEEFGDLDKGYQLAERGHAAAPEDTRTTDTLGWILYRRRAFASALPLLQESAMALTDEPEAQYHVGAAAYMLGREDAARSALERATRTGASFAAIEPARQLLAVLATPRTTPTPADRARIDRQLAQDASDPVALCRRSSWLAEAGDLEGAQRSAEAALVASPKDAAAMAQLARVRRAAGQPAEAVKLAKDAHELLPDDGRISDLLSQLVYDRGDFRWAQSLARDAAANLPNDAEVSFDYARAAYAVGDVDQASDATERALRLNPTFTRAAEARRLLEFVALAKAPQPATADRIQETLRNNPQSVPALMALAALSESNGDNSTARRSYEQVLEVFPDFAPAQKALTILYAADPANASKAAALASKARQAYPSDAKLAKAYGVIVYQQRDFARAALLLQESISGGDRDAEGLYYLGMAQFQLQQKSDSRQSLQQALALGLRAPLAAEARKSLASLE